MSKNCSKCKICSKTVDNNQHGIKCDLCSKWVHLKCNKLDKKDYVSYQTQEMDFCIKCIADTFSGSQLNIIKKINEAVEVDLILAMIQRLKMKHTQLIVNTIQLNNSIMKDLTP